MSTLPPRPNKTLYGIVALVPTALLLMSMLTFVLIIVNDKQHMGLDNKLLIVWCAVFFVLGSILSMVSMIVYIVLIGANKALDNGERLGWIIGMVAVPGVACVGYWVMRILKEKPPVTQPPVENEWDIRLKESSEHNVEYEDK